MRISIVHFGIYSTILRESEKIIGLHIYSQPVKCLVLRNSIPQLKHFHTQVRSGFDKITGRRKIINPLVLRINRQFGIGIGGRPGVQGSLNQATLAGYSATWHLSDRTEIVEYFIPIYALYQYT